MEKSQSSGMAGYVAARRRRLRLMLLLGLPVVLGSIALALSLPDVYVSSGVINIEQERLEGVRSSSKSASDDYIQEYVRSISATLLTEKMLAPAAASLDLYPDLKGNPSAAAGRIVPKPKPKGTSADLTKLIMGQGNLFGE